MRRSSKAVLWSVGGLATIVAAVLGTSALLFRDMCGNDVLVESTSPDGQWKAMVFTVDCGATTTSREIAPRVSLLRADRDLSQSDGGNIFGIGPTEKMPRPSLRAEWTGAHELTITYAADSRVFKQVAKYKDIRIRYVADRSIH